MTDDLNVALEEDVIQVDMDNDESCDQGESEQIEIPEMRNETFETIAWFQNLSDVEDEFEFEEFEHYKYKYEKVCDPDNTSSGKFLVFYKDTRKENPQWETLTHLMSDQYTVAKSEAILQNTIQNLNYNTEDTRVLSIPFKMATTISTNCPINLFEKDSMKTAFQIVTGIDANKLSNVSSKIDIFINNSYDGTSRVSRSYSIKTVIKTNELDRTFRNHFLLSAINESFIHVENDLGSASQKLSTAQVTANSTINLLANVKENINDFAEVFTKKMNKEMKKNFNGIWENIPDTNKNMLLLIVLISNVIEEHFDFKTFITLRSHVENLLINLMKAIANK